MQPRAEPPDRVRLEPHQHLAGQARAAAAPGAARASSPTARAASDLGVERGRHWRAGTIASTAPGSARTLTGSSPTGSPSAYIVNGRSALIVTSRAADDLDVRQAHVGTAQHAWRAQQEPQASRGADHHHVELTVLQRGVGREHHAGAVEPRVGGGDRVPGKAPRLATVELDRERRRLPAGKRPEEAVDVHELAGHDPGVVGDPVGHRVKAAARDSHIRDRVDFAEVELSHFASVEHVTGRHRRRRDPEHAHEVVSTPAGQDAQHAVRARERAGDSPHEPIASEGDRRGTSGCGLFCQLSRVVEAAGVVGSVL